MQVHSGFCAKENEYSAEGTSHAAPAIMVKLVSYPSALVCLPDICGGSNLTRVGINPPCPPG